VTRQDLATDARRAVASEPVRELIAYECRRAARHYAAARPGLRMLEPRSRTCIRAAYLLYGGILDEVRRAGYDVLRARVRVPLRRRVRTLAVAAGSERQFEARAARFDAL
jgi:phytoene synthase